MKRLMVCFITLTLVVTAGCAAGKPEFSQAYLPNAVPGMAAKRIDLTASVNDAVKKRALPSSNIEGLPLSLYWVEEDNILFTVLNKDRKWLRSFLVKYSTGQAKVLDDAEKSVFLSKIEKKIVADKTGSLGEFVGFAFQTAVALAGGGSGSSKSDGEHFRGSLENNGYVLDVDAKVKRNKWSIFPSSYNCKYSVKNRQTGEALQGTAKIEKVGKKRESLETWLKSWRISPDGRSYFAVKTATLITADAAEGKPLIENYPYAALDINPVWDRIAMLVIKEDEKTKQTSYWIEFYGFNYRR